MYMSEGKQFLKKSTDRIQWRFTWEEEGVARVVGGEGRGGGAVRG